MLIGTITTATADYFGLDPRVLLGESRTAVHAKARHVAWYIAVEKNGLTQTDVAAFFGRSDHSTVSKAVGKIKDEIKLDSYLSGDIKQILHNVEWRYGLEPRDPIDTLQTARSVMRNPRVGAMRLSVEEMVAITDSFLELYDIAVGGAALARNVIALSGSERHEAVEPLISLSQSIIQHMDASCLAPVHTLENSHG